jgi:Rrf2 family iron-sulfur cluster assembly transcriptional regulator
MKVTVRAEYSCLAMMALASVKPGQPPLRVQDMATSQGISRQFLVQVLQQLKAAGLVDSVRGASGGFRLGRPANRITLAEIVDAVDDAARLPKPLFTETSTTREMEVISALWRQIHQKQRQILEGTSLGDLITRSRTPEDLIYVI